MIDLFLERTFATPCTIETIASLSQAALPCFALHRVAWQGSLLSRDGRRMVCRFRAPDVESCRTALRQTKADARGLWPGTVHEAPGEKTDAMIDANVLVERRFAQAVTLARVQALEDAGAGCLSTYRGTLRTHLFCPRCPAHALPLPCRRCRIGASGAAPDRHANGTCLDVPGDPSPGEVAIQPRV